jgi:hypothetical protein
MHRLLICAYYTHIMWMDCLYTLAHISCNNDIQLNRMWSVCVARRTSWVAYLGQESDPTSTCCPSQQSKFLILHRELSDAKEHIIVHAWVTRGTQYATNGWMNGLFQSEPHSKSDYVSLHVISMPVTPPGERDGLNHLSKSHRTSLAAHIVAKHDVTLTRVIALYIHARKHCERIR